jgi:hypothetical protein
VQNAWSGAFQGPPESAQRKIILFVALQLLLRRIRLRSAPDRLSFHMPLCVMRARFCGGSRSA